MPFLVLGSIFVPGKSKIKSDTCVNQNQTYGQTRIFNGEA